MDDDSLSLKKSTWWKDLYKVCREGQGTNLNWFDCNIQ